MIIDEPIWKKIKPYSYIEPVVDQGRNRRRLSGYIPPALLEDSLRVKTQCANCRKLMYPVRLGAYGPSLNVACKDKDNSGCKKTRRAREAVKRLEAEIDNTEIKDPRQDEMF